MSGEVTSNPKKTRLIHDPSSIYYLHPSEGPGNSLTKYLLKSDNFDIWEKAIRNALGGRGKSIFLSSVGITKPTDEHELSAWCANHQIICSWIFNSVDESIQPSIVSHSIAYELWDDLRKRYSCSNGPRVYQLKSELNAKRQKGQSVVSYYNQFITLWNQLYGSSDLTGGCRCEAAGVTRARIERDKTVDFLLGLDDEQFGNIRSQIIGTEPVPDLDRAYFLVTQEERHCHIIRTRDDRTDSVAFAAKQDKRLPVPNKPSCSHCGRTNHSIDTCFELIGFPSQFACGGGRGRGSRGGSFSGGRGGPRYGSNTPAGSGQAVQGGSGSNPVGSGQAVQGGSSSNPAAVHASISDSSGNLSDQMSRLMSMLEASASHTYTGPFVADGDWTGGSWLPISIELLLLVSFHFDFGFLFLISGRSHPLVESSIHALYWKQWALTSRDTVHLLPR
ncbi:unnamed protein product [Cuscuta campestris]|uniref:Retrotransposon Copia-like N-terminal domain-containing protein n=1 Tax=Cuscuta campestris TaxID=132261 RepID=A0A484M780_9ASTE|nr:unnamed protein product [Cuscuta campestris]